MRGAAGGILALLLFGRTAWAEPGSTPVAHAPAREPAAVAAQPQATDKRWYGAPIIVGDVVSLGVAGLGISDLQQQGALVGIGLAGFALHGPATHAVHGQWGKAGLSLLLRVGLPYVGLGILGSNACPSDSDNNCAKGLVTGVFVGALAAAALDAGALAYEPAREAPLQPALAAGANYAWIGASGRF
jgi:hypothetical protein